MPKWDAPNPRFQTLPKTTNFEYFLEGKPDGILYEQHDRVIVERQPIGEHEEIKSFLGGEVTVELKRLNLPYFIPKQALIKVPDRESAYSPHVLYQSRLRRNNIKSALRKSGVKSNQAANK